MKETITMPTRRFTLSALAVLSACAFTLPAAAQQAFPTKPVKIVVPFTAGGSSDVQGRMLADALGRLYGQSVIVDNRPGAGGSIGAQLVARAKPDGYTLLMGNIGPVAINFSLYKKLQYKESDLRGITNVISVPNILVVNADTPVKTVQELIAWGKQKPLTAATSGIGQSPHMSTEMFRQKAGLDVTLVPHSGAAPAVTALLGKQTDFMIDNLPSSIPHIKSGKFRALAITSKERSPQLPDVPTMREAGVPMDVTAWFDLLAPAGTPDAIVHRIQQVAHDAMQTAEIRSKFAELGGVPGGESAAEHDAFIAQERKNWAQIVKAANLSLD